MAVCHAGMPNFRTDEAQWQWLLCVHAYYTHTLIITSLVPGNTLLFGDYDVNYEVIPTKIQGLSGRLLVRGSWCKWLYIVCLDLANTFKVAVHFQ